MGFKKKLEDIGEMIVALRDQGSELRAILLSPSIYRIFRELTDKLFDLPIFEDPNIPDGLFVITKVSKH